MAPKTQSALLGGLFIGILSALPIVSAGNLCCCLWVIAGGVLSAYVLQQNQTEPIALGEGAWAGFVAGITGAFVYVLVTIPFSFVLAPLQRRMLERIIARAPEVSGDFGGMMGRFAFGVVGLFVWFFVMLVVGTLFATLGGLLGAALFRKEPPRPIEPVPGTLSPPQM